MKTERIEQIAEIAAENLKELIMESEEQILEAIKHAAEEAQIKSEETGRDVPLKLALGHKISIDLGSNELTNTLSWSVPYKNWMTTTLQDPNQPELPMDEDGNPEEVFKLAD